MPFPVSVPYAVEPEYKSVLLPSHRTCIPPSSPAGAAPLCINSLGLEAASGGDGCLSVPHPSAKSLKLGSAHRAAQCSLRAAFGSYRLYFWVLGRGCGYWGEALGTGCPQHQSLGVGLCHQSLPPHSCAWCFGVLL